MSSKPLKARTGLSNPAGLDAPRAGAAASARPNARKAAQKKRPVTQVERNLADLLFDDAAPITNLLAPIVDAGTPAAAAASAAAEDAAAAKGRGSKKARAGDAAGALASVVREAASESQSQLGLFELSGAGGDGAGAAAAWADEDDSAHAVDIASTNRTRKLRVAEDETVISSEEFIKRQRKQFTAINHVRSVSPLFNNTLESDYIHEFACRVNSICNRCFHMCLCILFI